MDYNFIDFKIKDLVELIDRDRIDLNPPYQRNFIWSPKDQMELIDTILKNFPLPNFFMYRKPDNTYEMVDGQQRSKTIYRFVKGQITSSKKTGQVSFKDVDDQVFLNYRLPVIVLENLNSIESLNEYYVWINKKGSHLNVSEVAKSEFQDTNFMKLATEVLEYQNLIDLNLFSETVSKRMNDRAFIEELLGYLQLGIKDKKKSVEYIYTENDLTEEEFIALKEKFYLVIDTIKDMQSVAISKTRYRQKNDFYTLFNFVNENIEQNEEVFAYQYRILVYLDGTDDEGRQHIRPTNDDCDAFKSYAINCVSQSNSKQARENRLEFFNAILKNSNLDKNEILKDVLNYFEECTAKSLKLIDVEKYQLIDVD